MNLICSKCGGTEFYKLDGRTFCRFCRSEIVAPTAPSTSTIDLNADVERLLEKCRKDPKRASRYASLALDIDPFNAEARKYL